MEEEKETRPVEGRQLSFLHSRSFIIILWGIAIVLLLLVTFKAGELIESQRADFAYQWGQNYYHNFFGRPSGVDLDGNRFMTSYGAFGPIISIAAPDFVIQDQNNNVEKNILTSTNTIIREMNGNISFGDLGVSERVIVIGQPNNSGEIEARLVRVVPVPTTSLQIQPQ